MGKLLDKRLQSEKPTSDGQIITKGKIRWTNNQDDCGHAQLRASETEKATHGENTTQLQQTQCFVPLEYGGKNEHRANCGHLQHFILFFSHSPIFPQHNFSICAPYCGSTCCSCCLGRHGNTRLATEFLAWICSSEYTARACPIRNFC